MDTRVSITMKAYFDTPRGTSHWILHDEDRKVEFNIFLEPMDSRWKLLSLIMVSPFRRNIAPYELTAN